MSAYVLIDGKQQGPYSIEHLQGLLSSSTINRDTLAWHVGMTEWQPIGAWLSRFQPQVGSPLPASRNPGLGIASFVIGVAGVCGWPILLFVAGVAHASGARETHPLVVAVGLLLFVGLGLNVMGAILGLVALPKRTLTVIGIALNFVEIIGMVLLIVVGMAMKH